MKKTKKEGPAEDGAAPTAENTSRPENGGLSRSDPQSEKPQPSAGRRRAAKPAAALPESPVESTAAPSAEPAAEARKRTQRKAGAPPTGERRRTVRTRKIEPEPARASGQRRRQADKTGTQLPAVSTADSATAVSTGMAKRKVARSGAPKGSAAASKRSASGPDVDARFPDAGPAMGIASKAGPISDSNEERTEGQSSVARESTPFLEGIPQPPVAVASRPAVEYPDADTLVSDSDIYLFNEGTHHRLYDKLGGHLATRKGIAGAWFGVWAPSASSVSVAGDFNDWNPDADPLARRGESGVWEAFIAGVTAGSLYKYHIVSAVNGYCVDKTDPFGFLQEVPPRTASALTTLDYEWRDAAWMKNRARNNSLEAPMSIYEVHLGSWARVPDEDFRSLTYLELAPRLTDYVKEVGFTHVELLPVMEHPFFGSWGYQTTGYFAPSSRFGSPQDLMTLIDHLHQNGIGVILDWVPSHFPTDEHGLGYFDGTHLFEHADPRQGFHQDWKSLIFNYGRNEVRSFLLSSAMFWLDKYHADGLRVDAVASMLYLDYSRKEGEWIPNQFGGRDNLEALEFLRQLNLGVYTNYPDVQMIAEESTAWPMVSRPTYLGGLGFGLKWDMGWMHDTLRYFSHEAVYRKFHHNELTFRSIYAFTENFVMPLSHDEVVHGKGSLINKMQGDDWQKFANLRLLFAYMYAQPGKKLIFMGGEIGQWREWNHDGSIDWHLLDLPLHSGVHRAVSDLNRLYRDLPALHELDCSPDGFEWLDANDSMQSVLTFIRQDRKFRQRVIAAFNFTPIVRYNYRIGAPLPGIWKEIFNSDAEDYGGSGQGNLGQLEAAPIHFHGRPQSLNVTLPPLGAVFFVHEEELLG